MITKNLTSALENIGFTYADNKDSSKSHAYALYGGYLITVYEISGKKVAYFNFKFSDNEENSIKRYALSEAFSGEMEEYSISDYSIEEEGMTVTSGAGIPAFLKLIDRCVELLNENKIKGAEYCSKCGNKFGSRNPKKVLIEKSNYLMCEHCAINTVEEINNAADEKKKEEANGSLGLGILGSVLFSLIGVAVYFALYYWLSPIIGNGGVNEARYIFCAAGFIVSLLSYLGFRIFCKKSGTSAYITIAVSSLLFTAIGQYLGSVFEFIAKSGYSLSALSKKAFWLVHIRNTIPADVASQFVDHSAVFYKLLAISLMFAAVGTAIFLLTLHDKSIVKKETVVVETLKMN